MRYIAKRMAQTVLVILLASLALFMLLRAIPGDPAAVLAGQDASPSTIAAIREQYGLDNPVPIQYIRWSWSVLGGDLGMSLGFDRPVSELIGGAMQPTLQLLIAALILSIIVGVGLGVLAASHARRWPDVMVGYLTATLLGVPVFWMGILALLVFSVSLGWLPSGGAVSLFEDPALAAQQLLLPATVLGLGLGSVLARFVRAAMLESLTADYVRTARAKGVSQWGVVWRHAFRNALIPIITILGIQLGALLGGAVVIEQVFSRPGMGSLLMQSVFSRDYPVVQGVVLMLVAGYSVANLIIDLSYGIIDPRIRR